MKRELRRAAMLGLSAGLVLTSLAGCSKKNGMDMEEAAITVNGDEISAGVLNFAVRYDQAGLEGAYMSFGITDPFNQDLFGGGQTLGEMAKEQEAERLTHALLAEQKMEEYGVSVTDDEKAGITAAASAFIEANDADTLEKIGVTQEYVERYLELLVVQTRMEHEMSADVDTEVSDEEAAQRRVQYVFFAPVTEEEEETETETEGGAEITPAETEQAAEEQTEGETIPGEASLVREESVLTAAADETESEVTAAEMESEVTAAETETETETEDPETAAAMARALAQAEEFLCKLQAGEDFAAAAEELGKNANEMTLDDDYYVAEVAEATKGLADDTLVETPVKTENGYYVVKVLSQLDREATDAEKENIVAQRKADRIEELYTEWEEAGEVSQNDEILAAIVFDYTLMTPTEAETEGETDLTPAEAVTEANVTPAEMETLTEAETDLTPAETEAE